MLQSCQKITNINQNKVYLTLMTINMHYRREFHVSGVTVAAKLILVFGSLEERFFVRFYRWLYQTSLW